MSRHDFQVILHTNRPPSGDYTHGETRYVVSIRHVGGVHKGEGRQHVVLEDYPHTEDGYNSANRLCQRLVKAIEEQTMPFFTGHPMAGLRVDYHREKRTHREEVE